MNIITYNVNGLRAAMKKGFVEWLSDEYPDVICIQETKANKDQVEFELIENLGYNTYWFSAQKKATVELLFFPNKLQIMLNMEPVLTIWILKVEF